jgi:hypothetical protein
MIKHTKAERQEYFKQLRERWANAKKLSLNDNVAKALYQESGGAVSYTSFYLTLTDMKRLGYEGLPYIDCKTFAGWKTSGFKVKKGEHSKLSGITWIGAEAKDDDNEDVYIYPKIYRLFHKSQVESLT